MGLEPVRKGEGVVFLKGSHKWGRKFMPFGFAATGQKAALQESMCPHQTSLKICPIIFCWNLIRTPVIT